MGDERFYEKIMKMKPLKKVEEIFLIRSCLKDGMTFKQAEEYIKAIRKEIKNNHEEYNKKIKKKEKSFKEEFKKIKERRTKLFFFFFCIFFYLFFANSY